MQGMGVDGQRDSTDRILVLCHPGPRVGFRPLLFGAVATLLLEWPVLLGICGVVIRASSRRHPHGLALQGSCLCRAGLPVVGLVVIQLFHSSVPHDLGISCAHVCSGSLLGISVFV